MDATGGAQWLKRGVYGYNSYFAFTGCYDDTDNGADGRNALNIKMLKSKY